MGTGRPLETPRRFAGFPPPLSTLRRSSPPCDAMLDGVPASLLCILLPSWLSPHPLRRIPTPASGTRTDADAALYGAPCSYTECILSGSPLTRSGIVIDRSRQKQQQQRQQAGSRSAQCPSLPSLAEKGKLVTKEGRLLPRLPSTFSLRKRKPALG
ncbi:hypothetical protein HPB50_001354 [Hyalomma asiaticum]|uniref:Uncharacterized protein n=1 Tax=Hyalomma asiaticum TaxID=266040 RepID=A0ACB7S6E2_HYAAI|nr:hypothetical protein HPB50_001354 [Hyalomma asiaticum]